MHFRLRNTRFLIFQQFQDFRQNKKISTIIFWFFVFLSEILLFILNCHSPFEDIPWQFHNKVTNLGGLPDSSVFVNIDYIIYFSHISPTITFAFGNFLAYSLVQRSASDLTHTGSLHPYSIPRSPIAELNKQPIYSRRSHFCTAMLLQIVTVFI